MLVFFHRFLEQFFQRVQFFTGNINGFNDGGSADTLHKVKHAHHLGHITLCLGAKESGGAVQTLFRTPVTQVKVEIGCVKLAVHLRVEFEKHSSGCHT
ncbi:Uncharacterised protein [Shigella sonnei]|nr:Uncharacterised protein [Shigella sonnei]